MKSPYETIRAKARETLAHTAVKGLKSRGYEAVYVPAKEQALAELLYLIPEKTSVGVGGSVTLREIGAPERLAESGRTVFHHWNPGLAAEERAQVLADASRADFYLTSANALTRDGTIVALDATGNRVSATAWGQNTLIYVIGINKVAENLDGALARTREASVQNALRIGLDLPCTHTGHCMNCNSPSRICRALLIMERPTQGRKSHVILVGEDLGF